MTHFRIICIVVSIFSMSAAYSGIIEPKTLWPKNEVRVCWANIRNPWKAFLTNSQGELLTSFESRSLNEALSSQQKSRVKTAVQAEYTSERTGIHFTGWKDFSADEPCDALLFTALTEVGIHGESCIGYKGQYSHSTSGYETSNALGLPSIVLEFGRSHSDSQLITTMLHEFGHLAGLRHELPPELEASRPGEIRPPLPVCLMTGELRGLSATVVTPFDSASIMNPCKIENSTIGSPAGELSIGDVTALRSVYL